MTPAKKIRFIYNPNSGFIHPSVVLKKLIARFFPKNLCEYDFINTEFKGHAKLLAQEAVQKNYDIVVAIGGDGTLNETASALVNTPTWFGIVPLGSGNGLARDLGIPFIIRSAVKLITLGCIRTIDAGEVNGKYFFTTAGFGFDAVVGKKFEESKMRGPAPYFLAGITEFSNYDQAEYTIRFEGHEIKTKALLVAVANVRQYGVNAIIAPSARPDDGLLDLCIVHSTTFLPIVIHLPKLFTGNIEKMPNVEFYQSKEFHIQRDRGDVYSLDGEIFSELLNEIRISVIPKALNVIVNDINYNAMW
jgi:diacylglycerol kinase (ATP)